MKLATAVAFATVLLALTAGTAAQDDAQQVEGYTYLYSTNLAKKQTNDVIRTIDSMSWNNGLVPKGMHKCARLCKREGGGGVCAAWTFCWNQRRCQLLSRLPGSLAAAQPGAVSSMMGANPYDAQCASGVSQGAVNTAKLATTCSAAVQPNTLFGDTMSLTATNRNRMISATYNANQKSAADCCALCASMRAEGCTSWSYQPGGWMIDRAHKCTLRQGVNPSITAAKGITSGVMN